MNRGLEKRDVFKCDADRRRFLRILRECVSRFHIGLYAYCLMGNHYHLLIEDERGQLSQAMRHLGGAYTQGFNKFHERDGPLFRGRFKSQVVEDGEYAVAVANYIHDNPVRAGMVPDPSRYLWSSYRYHALGKKPPWLRGLLPHGAVPETTVDTPSWSGRQSVIGSERFVAECRERVREQPQKMTREVCSGRKLGEHCLDEVLECLAGCLRLPKGRLVRACRGDRRVNDLRLLAVYVCREWTSYSNAEIGEIFGVQPPSVSVLARRGETFLLANRELMEEVRRLGAQLRVEI